MEGLVAEGGSSPEPCAIGEAGPGVTKRSWQQLRQAVRQTRCRLYGLASRLPSSVTFGKGRLYFLSPLTEGRESSLHYVDLPPHQAQGGSTEATGLAGSGNEGAAGAATAPSSTTAPMLQWRPLLDPKFHRCHPPGRLSREEQLQWERRRLMAWGITAFDYQAGRFVFPAGGSLFFCDDMPQVQSEP